MFLVELNKKEKKREPSLTDRGFQDPSEIDW
jgi:hypothetical protein